MKIPALCFAILPALAALPVAADEIWDSEAGPIIYETEIDDMALFSFSLPEGMGGGMMYLHGLAGNFEDRSVHSGFWIADEPGACSASLTGPDGRSSRHFGMATVIFDRPGWPSGFTAILDHCMDGYGDPTIIRAEVGQI